MHYSRSFSGYIWKIRLDQPSGKVWVEMRDEAAFEMSLFCIDVKLKKDLQISFDPALGWWDNLSYVYDDIVVIQRITDTKNPGPADVWIVDSRNNETIKRIQHVQIDGYQDGTIYFSQKDNVKNDLQFTFKEDGNLTQQLVNLPAIYPEGHDHNQLVVRFLLGRNITSVGPVGYFEKDQHIIISYHIKSDRSFNRYLIWLHQGIEVLHEMIDEEMKGYSHESFFTFGNYLIFIKNRKHLLIYNLNNEHN